MILEFCAVALGGALGSVLRAVMMLQISTLLKPNFPVALLVINWLGCLLIGLFAGFMVRGHWSAIARSFWVIGLCGGFTTFSSFSYDLFGLLQNSEFLKAATYLLISIFFGLLLFYFGQKIAQNI